jgi:predicted P-loop ATPase
MFNQYNFNKSFVSLIPTELTQLSQFCVWAYRPRGDKFSKMPFNPHTGRAVKTTDSTTLSSFNDCLNVLSRTQKYNGIGFVFQDKDGLTGIDIDHCIVNRQFTPVAKEILARFKQTYCEISPSGEGLRIFCYGTFARCGKNTGKEKWLEVYNHTSPRYLTVTGNHLKSCGKKIVNCQESLDWLFETYFKPENGVSNDILKPVEYKPSVSPNKPVKNGFSNDLPLSDNDILNIARKAKNAANFEALWSGQGSDKSSGDLALCSLLAFYTQDSAQIDRLFRQSSRMREKWDSKRGNATYGQSTIEKAIKGLSATFSAQPKPSYSKPLKPITQAKPIEQNKPIESTTVKEVESKKELIWLRNKDGTPKNVVLNIKNVLLDDEFKGVLALNTFSNQIVKLRKPPYVNAELGEWTDVDNTNTALWISAKYGFSPDSTKIQEVAVAIAHENAFNPVKDYLNSLKWDNTPRAEKWLSRYLGVVDNEYSRLVGKTWLISAVARVMQPGCKADNVLILEGKQGIGKSTALRVLFSDDFFSDTPIDIGSKDAFLAIQGVWCVELAELDTLNRTDAERAKAFISSLMDKFRPPYGRNDIVFKRQVVFAGTVNRDSYLKDATGNRRYLPVKCAEIDIEALKRDRDMLWAEIVALYKAGEKWWFDSNNPLVLEEQESRLVEDVWHDDVVEFLESNKTKEYVTVSEILDYLDIPTVSRKQSHLNQIANILKSLDYKKERPTIGGKRVWAYTKPVKPVKKSNHAVKGEI